MGKWSSNAFLRYIHIQVINLSKGISNIMNNNQALYKILEAEIVYNMPGKDDTKTPRLNLLQRGQ